MVFSLAASYLSTARRDRVLEQIRAGNTEWDLVVIGAGITGVGIALDAQLRGLQVLLVDAQDLAFGTSRWSSKLAHGGLRYLATGNVGVAERSARERGILMEVTAPHLTHKLPQVVPILDEFKLNEKLGPRLGFIAGDTLRILAGTSSRTLPRSRMISARRVQELCPTVQREGLRGGSLNFDGQLVDDARLVTAVARTAAGYGADVLTYARAVRATGTEVVLRDEAAAGTPAAENHDAAELTVRARAVVNATGVWAGELQPGFKITPSRGTHVIIPAEKVGNPTGALTVPVPGNATRFCFVLPEPFGRCFLGITDAAIPGPIRDVPEAPQEDVEWILDVINRALATKLSTDDVIGAFCGLRPLLSLDQETKSGKKKPKQQQQKSSKKSGSDSSEPATADLSREHAVFTDPNGLITVSGGKLTEYRFMAEQTVDTVVASLGGAAAVGAKPCSTAKTPLLGAPNSAGTRGTQRSDLKGLPKSMVAHYGYEAPHVARQARCARPFAQITPGIAVTRAEVEFALRCEGAFSAADLLDRRFRIGLVEADRTAAEPAVRELAAELGLTLQD